MKDRRTALFVAITTDGLFLIQDRRNKPGSKIDYGLFGGGIETGESHQQAVIREIEEELSVKYDAKDLDFVGEFYMSFDGVGGFCNLYTKKVDSNEIDRYKCMEGEMLWIKKDEIFNYLNIAHKPLFDKL